MNYLLLILLLSGWAMAASPKYNYSDPRLNDEMDNIYNRLDRKIPTDPESFTKAQLTAMVPRKVGRLYYCSDCTTDGIVVSTGTGVGAFARVTARTTAFQ